MRPMTCCKRERVRRRRLAIAAGLLIHRVLARQTKQGQDLMHRFPGNWRPDWRIWLKKAQKVNSKGRETRRRLPGPRCGGTRASLETQGPKSPWR